MSDAIKLAIDTLQNTIDCLMRENEKNDGPICDTIWYDDHTTLFDYINCELAALRAQPDHSELVKDAARYAHVLECDYLATKTYLPDTTREERYAKLREKHDAGRKAIGETDGRQ